MNDARDEIVTGVVVVAAGLGTRLGAGMPKALVPIGGEPMVVHAVRRARAAQHLAHVVVVAPPGRDREMAALLPHDVQTVPGGDSRTASVATGLAALDPRVGVVLVHDAARALAPPELFDRVRQAVLDGADAAVPGLPVVDTIKQVDETGAVIATPDRARLRAIQTPQAFDRAVLDAAHAAGLEATDDAALVEAAGGRVVVVPGEADAVKVTTAADLTAIQQRAAGSTPAPVSADRAFERTQPTLIVLGGLPGTGKTTLARALAVQLGATHLRIDALEWALHAAGVRADGGEDVHPFAGYAAGYAAAATQLAAGGVVIADAVNPVAATRAEWERIAAEADARLLRVEVVCTDVDLHRRRVQERVADLAGHRLPTWDEVTAREYEPWQPELRLDAAQIDVDEQVRAVRAQLTGSETITA